MLAQFAGRGSVVTSLDAFVIARDAFVIAVEGSAALVDATTSVIHHRTTTLIRPFRMHPYHKHRPHTHVHMCTLYVCAHIQCTITFRNIYGRTHTFTLTRVHSQLRTTSRHALGDTPQTDCKNEKAPITVRR